MRLSVEGLICCPTCRLLKDTATTHNNVESGFHNILLIPSGLYLDDPDGARKGACSVRGRALRQNLSITLLSRVLCCVLYRRRELSFFIQISTPSIV